MRARVASFAAVAGLVTVGARPAPARADPAEDAARARLDAGVAAFRAGDFERAHRELAAASALVPDKPNPHRWLALTEVQLGDCQRALASIDRFVARVPGTDPRLAELERLRELCRRTGALRVDATPRAALRLDGALVGETPFASRSLRAGAHVLVAERPGYATATRRIELAPGGALAVRLTLAPAPRPRARRWWIWAAAGGLAAAAAVAALAIAAGDDGPVALPPLDCDPTGCRPGAAR